jgi:hypothetical protein
LFSTQGNREYFDVSLRSIVRPCACPRMLAVSAVTYILTLLLTSSLETSAANDDVQCNTRAGILQTSLTFGTVAPGRLLSRDIPPRMAQCFGISECQILINRINTCEAQIPSTLSMLAGPAVEATVGFEDKGCAILRNCSSVLVDQEVYDTVRIMQGYFQHVFLNFSCSCCSFCSRGTHGVGFRTGHGAGLHAYRASRRECSCHMCRGCGIPSNS